MPYEIISSANNIQYATKAMRAELQKALQDTGQYVRGKMATYPPQEQPGYRRTGTLKKSMAVSKTQRAASSMWVDVGAKKYYAQWVNRGTGIYGPQATPIKPKKPNGYLAWRSSGRAYTGVYSVMIASGFARRKSKAIRNRKRDVYMNFARTVKGQPAWNFMEKAFDADSQTYFRNRLMLAVQRIQAMGGVSGKISYGYSGSIGKGLSDLP